MCVAFYTHATLKEHSSSFFVTLHMQIMTLAVSLWNWYSIISQYVYPFVCNLVFFKPLNKIYWNFSNISINFVLNRYLPHRKNSERFGMLMHNSYQGQHHHRPAMALIYDTFFSDHVDLVECLTFLHIFPPDICKVSTFSWCRTVISKHSCFWCMILKLLSDKWYCCVIKVHFLWCRKK